MNLNIDSDRDARVFRERLEDNRRDIEVQIEAAQRAVPWRGRTKLAVDVIAGATGGAVGATLDGVHGAMLGGAVGVIAAPCSTKTSSSCTCPPTARSSPCCTG